MADHTMQERMDAAAEAKRAMLEKFRTKPALDPALAAERAAQAKARDAKRVEAEGRRKARIEAEKAARIAEAQTKAKAAEEEAVRATAQAEADRLTAIEAAEILASEQKAARDLRYAARKARK